jgi:hypothetical protein
MAPQKTKVEMPGVANGKELTVIPTGDEVTAKQRVSALLDGSIAEESGYEVKTPFSFLIPLEFLTS